MTVPDLGIFHFGCFVEAVRPDPALPADGGREQTARAYRRIHELAAIAGPDGLPSGFEVLLICPVHPERSVIGCVDCGSGETS